MSILQSSNSGRHKIIDDYFKKVYKKYRESWVNIDYKIVKTEKDYKVIFDAHSYGQIITVIGYQLPCQIDWENSPYMIFLSFTKPEHYKLIPKNFKECYHYEFRNCNFSENQVKLVIKHISNIKNSYIQLPDNFFSELVEKYNIDLYSFINNVLNGDNHIFLKEYTSPQSISINEPFMYKEITHKELDNYLKFMRPHKMIE